MRIALVQFVYYEYLGLMYLSSCLKGQGHEVEVFIPSSRHERFLPELIEFRPDVVGFSVMSGHEDMAVALARRIKAATSAYIVFGGPHPTYFPEVIEAHSVDCACLGEAERTFSEIVEVLSRAQMPAHVLGAWCKVDGAIVRNEMRPLDEELGSLPRPDRTLYNKFGDLSGGRISLIAGRGCPYACTFCYNSKLHRMYKGKGSYVRLRHAEDIIEEIREVLAAGPAKSVYFQDDTFTLNRPWLATFLDKYRAAIALPFSCQIRADTVDENIVKQLKQAGCSVVSFGIETGNEQKRHDLLKKGLTDRDIFACSALLHEHRIRFRTYNILGLPGEGLDDAFKTIKLNSAIGTHYPWCSLYQPLPGTELAERCLEEQLYERDVGGYEPSFFQGSPLRLERKNDIINLHKLFFYAVRFPRLERLIRIAIRLQPNALYHFLFLVGHAWVYYFSELVSCRSLLPIGMMNLPRYFGRARTSALRGQKISGVAHRAP
jgi:radical SAM superfamily enzyme YgiQ (UPF0313 family)